MATLAAFDAIAATLPLGPVGYNDKGERLIWIETAAADELSALRGSGGSVSSCGWSRSRRP